MSVLVCGLGCVSFAFFTHLLLWRIRLPLRQTRALLAVFAGITMFGFWGLIIGPVIMIVIVTTISVYLAVYKGVPLQMSEPDEAPGKPGKLRLMLARARKRAWADRAADEKKAEQETPADPRRHLPTHPRDRK